MAVTKEIKETIAVTIDEVFKKMNSISWLERQKAMKDEAFKKDLWIMPSADTTIVIDDKGVFLSLIHI